MNRSLLRKQKEQNVVRMLNVLENTLVYGRLIRSDVENQRLLGIRSTNIREFRMDYEKDKPLVSVIMPVYNAREYIGDAILSVLRQTYKNLELIVVDDGSTDGSSLICDAFERHDTRVHVIHQKNHGLCAARNIGLEISEGRYIVFIDDDDIILSDAIRQMVDVAVDNSADLVKGTYVGEIINKVGKKRIYKAKMPNVVYSMSDLVNDYLHFNYAVRALWNGLYRIDIIRNNGIRFDENLKTGAEDYLFNLEYIQFVSQVGLIDYPVYKHFAREGQSTSIGYNKNRQNGIIKAYHIETRFFKQYEITAETYIREQVHYFYMLVRELSFSDTPLHEDQVFEQLKVFTNEMESFMRIRFLDVVPILKTMPKLLIQWRLLRSKRVKFLYRHYKRKHS